MARQSLNTGDIVQDAILQFLHRLEYFEPRQVGSVQAYLKRSIINRVYDEARKAARQPRMALMRATTADGPSA